MNRAAPVALFILLALTLAGDRATAAIPSFQKVRSTHTTTEAFLLDRSGEVIHELRVDARGRRLDWIGLKEISPSLQKSVLKSEDKRFYQHAGVDWIALSSATLRNIISS